MEKNQYFSRRPSIINQPLKVKQKPSSLCLVLKRLTNQNLLYSMERLKKNSQIYIKTIHRMQRISSINSQICIIVAWNKIKQYSRQNRTKTRVFRDVLILGSRIQKWLLKQSFVKLKQKVYKNNNIILQKFEQLRRVTLGRTLRNLSFKNKKVGWSLLKNNLQKKRQLKRLGIICTIMNGVIGRNISLGWLRLNSYNKKMDCNSQKSIEELQCQLQDMKIQVQNKNENVNRLKQQIKQLKQSFLLKPEDQSSLFCNHQIGSKSFTNLQKSRNKVNNIQKDSNDGSVKENSFGSILGSSYMSAKSKGSNTANRGQQFPCSSCNYRQKYQKYKTTNETLKKQLQIIKTELQFTKDMNQHMENEIKANLSYEEKDRDKKLEVVRNQLKQCQKDREALRQKVLKYEKYVAKLKQQFKTKIQEIYRRVKKNV